MAAESLVTHTLFDGLLESGELSLAAAKVEGDADNSNLLNGDDMQEDEDLLFQPSTQGQPVGLNLLPQTDKNLYDVCGQPWLRWVSHGQLFEIQKELNVTCMMVRDSHKPCHKQNSSFQLFQLV